MKRMLGFFGGAARTVQDAVRTRKREAMGRFMDGISVVV
jgi:hypothetical protein